MNAAIPFNAVKDLRKMYGSNPVAEALFDWWSNRVNSSRETKARVAADRTNHTQGEIVGVFRGLEELRLGTFVVGRRGAESRFQWDYDPRSLASVARGDKDEIELISDDAPLEDDDDEAETADGELLTHEYNLRPDHRISLDLPVDLTPIEAERLAAWIKTLPFEASE
jgi:hypothetical protein